MKVAEILRKLADIVDNAEKGNQEPLSTMGDPMSQNLTQQRMTTVEPETPDDADSKGREPELTVMVPPLQQKMEILKKLADLPNEYDRKDDLEDNEDEDEEEKEEPEDDEDEVSKIKRMAGIESASEDNDITG